LSYCPGHLRGGTEEDHDKLQVSVNVVPAGIAGIQSEALPVEPTCSVSPLKKKGNVWEMCFNMMALGTIRWP
jgi:hypothetical protein